MTNRARLPNRRAHEGFEVRHAGFTFHVGVERYDDSRVAEVFISCAKIATASDLLGKDAATIISIACQYGVPLSAFRPAMCRTEDGRAESFIGAILDAIDGPRPENERGEA